MCAFIRDDRGNVLAFTAAALFTMLLFATLATDIGYILTAQNQLQSAVDAAALAGASGLLYGHGYANYMAIHYGFRNDCMRWPVIILPGDVTFPNAQRIRVHADKNLNTFFLRLIGMQNKTITATAIAELGYASGTNGMRPWGVPDYNYQPGDEVVIKAGELGAPATNPSFFYPVDFPAVNRGTPIGGASEYDENIKYGSDETVYVDDIIQVEPGNMVGPTSQGIDYLIDSDPGAYWDGDNVANSNSPGFSSPRIVKIPLFDPSKPPDSGRNTITVTALASFFIKEMRGRDVVAVFMEMTTSGPGGGGWSLLRTVRLVS